MRTIQNFRDAEIAISEISNYIDGLKAEQLKLTSGSKSSSTAILQSFSIPKNIVFTDIDQEINSQKIFLGVGTRKLFVQSQYVRVEKIGNNFNYGQLSLAGLVLSATSSSYLVDISATVGSGALQQMYDGTGSLESQYRVTSDYATLDLRKATSININLDANLSKITVDASGGTRKSFTTNTAYRIEKNTDNFNYGQLSLAGLVLSATSSSYLVDISATTGSGALQQMYDGTGSLESQYQITSNYGLFDLRKAGVVQINLDANNTQIRVGVSTAGRFEFNNNVILGYNGTPTNNVVLSATGGGGADAGALTLKKGSATNISLSAAYSSNAGGLAIADNGGNRFILDGNARNFDMNDSAGTLQCRISTGAGTYAQIGLQSGGVEKIFLDANLIELRMGGNRVVTTRGSAVADPSGGVVIDVECRAQLVLLLGRLRVTGGHGLIAD